VPGGSFYGGRENVRLQDLTLYALGWCESREDCPAPQFSYPAELTAPETAAKGTRYRMPNGRRSSGRLLRYREPAPLA